MLTKISRQDSLQKYPSFPLRIFQLEEEEYELSYPRVFTSYVLTLSSKTVKGHISQLAIHLHQLVTELGFGTVIFLGDLELPWLYQQNEYQPAKEAQEYLKKNKIGKRFNGAIKVDRSQLPDFAKQLSWLTRCNASLPDFYFSDPGQNIMGNICRYSNLHIDTLNEVTDKEFNRALQKSRFTRLNSALCVNQFGKTSTVSGRRILM